MKKMVSIVFTIDDNLDEMEIIKNVKKFLKEEFLIENFGHHVKPIIKR
ncbi:MAG: hypothetical protein ACTSWZ_07390 [Candidatus Heimdallarchaeaceae archaeon]